MAKCDHCGRLILFGGKREDDLCFCNEKCYQKGILFVAAAQIPHDIIKKHIREVHQGKCLKCNGEGPIDIHTSHKVWSFLVITSSQSQPQLSCRTCGIKSQLNGIISSLLLGWWGAWGLLITPIQIARNIIGIVWGPNSSKPSRDLERFIKIKIAGNLTEKNQNNLKT